MSENTWPTAITKIEPNKVVLRGYRIDELMGKIGFVQAIHLALMGELPEPGAARLLEAIFVSSVDHGVTPPSCQAALNIATAGAPLGSAVAGGLLSISKSHGGAIEDCMNVLLDAVDRQTQGGKNAGDTAAEVVAESREKKRRLPGFGHRVHSRDPRSKALFKLIADENLSGPYIGMAQAIETAIEKELGKKLPINVDGAIAAALCELKIPSALANAFFMIARLPGLIAHVHEEQTRMRPMRQINARDHYYDGPEERSLDDQ